MEGAKIWCDEDQHQYYENFADFNDWFELEENHALREACYVAGIAQPSKAFYAGDKEAYFQLLRDYIAQQKEALINQTFLFDLRGDGHWAEKNLARFEQLINRLNQGDVVPLVGAGMSRAGGFPTWKEHLHQQGRTADLDPKDVKKLLKKGQHETIIEKIEKKCSRDVFVQEIRDVFSKNGTITDTTLLLSELFKDTVLTTNYDRLLEQAYETGAESPTQIITSDNATERPDPKKVTLIKLHGDIENPQKCIISKDQYDQAYGLGKTDIALPLPRLLKYYYQNSSLLMLGCSLNDDRMINVFRTIKAETDCGVDLQHFIIEQAPKTSTELVKRNDYLLQLGITGIWFEPGQFETIEGMLRLAKIALGLKRAQLN